MGLAKSRLNFATLLFLDTGKLFHPKFYSPRDRCPVFQRVLDVGCGTAVLSLFCAKLGHAAKVSEQVYLGQVWYRPNGTRYGVVITKHGTV